MRRALRPLTGMDYRSQSERTRTREDWDADKAAIVAAGGYVRRIGGDTVVFDKQRRVVLEIYDGARRGEEVEPHA